MTLQEISLFNTDFVRLRQETSDESEKERVCKLLDLPMQFATLVQFAFHYVSKSNMLDHYKSVY